jgi:two-component system, OmpR family, sensor histidine kinase KdpD
LASVLLLKVFYPCNAIFEEREVNQYHLIAAVVSSCRLVGQVVSLQADCQSALPPGLYRGYNGHQADSNACVNEPGAASILRTAIMCAGLPAVSALYHYTLRANSTTAALTDLLLVLGAAVLWGLPEAMLASIVSMLCLDYYFLPPVPGFGIDDPQNWVAWGTFLITAFVVSELSARLKKRALEATQRQSEIQRMYALSCKPDAGQRGHRLGSRTFPDRWWRFLAVPAWPSSMRFPAKSIARVFRGGDFRRRAHGRRPVPPIRRAPAGAIPALVSVNLGDRTMIGSLAFGEASISAPAVRSIANLIALAMDRVRKQEAAAQAEGARRHHELKATLLDALAHDFQTPLTSIRAGIDAMLAESPGRDQREWLEIMDQESGRLSAMMTEDNPDGAALRQATWTSTEQTHTVEDLVYSALEKQMAAGSPIEVDLPQGLPPVSADAGLIRLVIRQIAANALKYSQPGAPIHSARARCGYRRGHQRQRPRSRHPG